MQFVWDAHFASRALTRHTLRNDRKRTFGIPTAATQLHIASDDPAEREAA
jgi:hypothetical protein